MIDFYLYGAGINCHSVINFFGNKHILGIIDRDKSLYGKKIDGIDVIPVEKYVANGNGADILVTPIYTADEIVKDLNKRGIRNAYKSPWMQNGFYSSPLEIAEMLKRKGISEVVFIEKNPLAYFIAEALEREQIDVHFVMELNTVLTDQNSVLLLACIPDMETQSFIETVANPCVKLYEYRFTEKRNERLNIFHNIHVGKRCFICGNGPSLNVKDIEIMHKYREICFGVNNIHKIFNRTNWRPNYYVIVDQKVIEYNKEQFGHMNFPIFIRSMNGIDEMLLNNNLFVFNGLLQSTGCDKFSSDISIGCYNGRTVIYEAIQIAAYMGFSEIYLLGVDMTRTEKPVHFYREDQATVGGWIRGDIDMALRCISYAGQVLKDRNVYLGNATRNVWWDHIPRVNFDELILDGER